MTRFAGKTAIVTGASRGIGLAIAQRLVADGAKVVITARKQEALDAAVAELGGPEVAVAVAGSGDDEAHQDQVIATAIETFGSADFFVNNTGINPVYGPMIDLDLGAAELRVVAALDGAAELPPVPDRREQVSARLHWMRGRTEGHHARGTNLIPFSMHNIDEIIEEMGLRLPRRQRVREWLLPPKPADYRWVTRRLLARRPRPVAPAPRSGAGSRRVA